MFLKIEHGEIIIYVHNFSLYFECDDFLTSFRIIVVLITYVMQVCEFRFVFLVLLFVFVLRVYLILYVV